MKYFFLLFYIITLPVYSAEFATARAELNDEHEELSPEYTDPFNDSEGETPGFNTTPPPSPTEPSRSCCSRNKGSICRCITCMCCIGTLFYLIYRFVPGSCKPNFVALSNNCNNTGCPNGFTLNNVCTPPNPGDIKKELDRICPEPSSITITDGPCDQTCQPFKQEMTTLTDRCLPITRIDQLLNRSYAKQPAMMQQQKSGYNIESRKKK